MLSSHFTILLNGDTLVQRLMTRGFLGNPKGYDELELSIHLRMLVFGKERGAFLGAEAPLEPGNPDRMAEVDLFKLVADLVKIGYIQPEDEVSVRTAFFSAVKDAIGNLAYGFAPRKSILKGFASSLGRIPNEQPVELVGENHDKLLREALVQLAWHVALRQASSCVFVSAKMRDEEEAQRATKALHKILLDVVEDSEEALMFSVESGPLSMTLNGETVVMQTPLGMEYGFRISAFKPNS